MFRLLVGPAIIGILAFSIVYFIIPLMFSESDTVAVFAQFTLDCRTRFSRPCHRSLPTTWPD